MQVKKIAPKLYNTYATGYVNVFSMTFKTANKFQANIKKKKILITDH